MNKFKKASMLLMIMTLTNSAQSVAAPATGAIGPQGIQGIQGIKGNKGDTGLAGQAGSTGPAGSAGAAGPKGNKGDIGVAGPAGPAGSKGNKGDIGLPGLRGPSGGAAGPQGPIGPQGSVGAASTVAGPKGDAGASGAQGPAGPAGAAGSGSGAGAAVHSIGEQYQGGIVYWVQADGQHGLIAAKADQHSAIQWFNGTERVTSTSGDGIGAGAMNTAIIVATQLGDNQTGNFAAKVAADYSIQADGVTACTGSSSEICYGDWYLPSKVELNLLYAQKTVVGGFADDNYWSSSENNSNFAWNQIFYNGSQNGGNKYYTLPVRAVRAF